MKKVFLAIITFIIIFVICFLVASNDKTEVTTNGEEQTATNESSTSEKTSTNEINEYIFTVNGKTVNINEEMDTEKFGEESNVYEVPSCAFEGNDKIYEYDGFEVETYEDGEKEKIYSIYFTDTKQTTTEGVCVSDSYQKMVDTYGMEFKNDGTQYTYTKNNTCLEFIVENEVITSIKYVLNTNASE